MAVEDYGVLKKVVEEGGFYTTFMPIKRVGDRLVCATEKDSAGLGGRSFWVAKRKRFGLVEISEEEFK